MGTGKIRELVDRYLAGERGDRTDLAKDGVESIPVSGRISVGKRNGYTEGESRKAHITSCSYAINIEGTGTPLNGILVAFSFRPWQIHQRCGCLRAGRTLGCPEDPGFAEPEAGRVLIQGVAANSSRASTSLVDQQPDAVFPVVHQTHHGDGAGVRPSRDSRNSAPRRISGRCQSCFGGAAVLNFLSPGMSSR